MEEKKPGVKNGTNCVDTPKTSSLPDSYFQSHAGDTASSILKQLEELHIGDDTDLRDTESSSIQPGSYPEVSSDDCVRSRRVNTGSRRPPPSPLSIYSERSSNAIQAFPLRESDIQLLSPAAASAISENSTDNGSMEVLLSCPLTPLNPLTKFVLFPGLPQELRLRIWKFCSFHESKRIVEITYERSIGKLVSLTPPPALLGINHEAREEAQMCFSQLPRQLPDDPPIYLDFEEDICFIREDSGGVLSDQNLLLPAIFGDGENVAAATLPSIKHLMLDWWVMRRACWDLSSLTKLRKLDSFIVVMKESTPQTALGYKPQSRAAPSARTEVWQLKRVGLQLYDILAAIRLLWGFMNYGLALSIRQALTDAEAELYTLKEIDTHWDIPEFQLMTFGYY